MIPLSATERLINIIILLKIFCDSMFFFHSGCQDYSCRETFLRVCRLYCFLKNCFYKLLKQNYAEVIKSLNPEIISSAFLAYIVITTHKKTWVFFLLCFHWCSTEHLDCEYCSNSLTLSICVGSQCF